MPALMVQGCTSWAGKSLLVTALCRWFARRGVDVVPFKAQNMANNARVVAGSDGAGEIGAAQWLQARAAGVTPTVAMNPVLLKPEADVRSQVVRLGRVDHELSRMPWEDRSERLWPTVRDSLDGLLATRELVLIEGAGSPAEINLAARDIVNMRVAEHADAPVLLVADIDRGGAFAHLYGTWALLPEAQRRRLAGFVLNRFRGDATLLPPGPQDLEALTGVPTVGVVPMLAHDLPDEDGGHLHRAEAGREAGGELPVVAVVRYPSASNLDEYTLLEQAAVVRWVRRPADLDRADLVVLPGSKHVASDLDWLAATGVGGALRRFADGGGRVLGICGGMQMLGERVVDEGGVDGTRDGLGLLPLVTTFARDKHVAARTVAFAEGLPAPWAALSALEVDGYEIRHGRTELAQPDGATVVALPDGLGWARGHVLGVYPHGLVEAPAVVQALAGRPPVRTLDDTFELLADAVEEHLDTDRLLEMAGIT